jgi:hypothetical protein
MHNLFGLAQIDKKSVTILTSVTATCKAGLVGGDFWTGIGTRKMRRSAVHDRISVQKIARRPWVRRALRDLAHLHKCETLGRLLLTVSSLQPFDSHVERGSLNV